MSAEQQEAYAYAVAVVACACAASNACAVDGCGALFANALELEKHLKQHLAGARRKDETCDVCGKAFATRGDLAVHRTAHNPNRTCVAPSECDACGKAFQWPSQLRNHKASAKHKAAALG
jgi:hypothetical protein